MAGSLFSPVCLSLSPSPSCLPTPPPHHHSVRTTVSSSHSEANATPVGFVCRERAISGAAIPTSESRGTCPSPPWLLRLLPITGASNFWPQFPHLGCELHSVPSAWGHGEDRKGVWPRSCPAERRGRWLRIWTRQGHLGPTPPGLSLLPGMPPGKFSEGKDSASPRPEFRSSDTFYALKLNHPEKTAAGLCPTHPSLPSGLQGPEASLWPSTWKAESRNPPACSKRSIRVQGNSRVA